MFGFLLVVCLIIIGLALFVASDQFTKILAKRKARIKNKLDRKGEDSSKIDSHVLVRARNGEQVIEVTIPTSRYTLRASSQ